MNFLRRLSHPKLRMLSGVSLFVLSIALVLFAPREARAGKVEAVKKAVMDACKKEIPEDQLMDVVIAAFDCTPGKEVKVLDCTIKCLKENKGTVVGK